MATIQPVALNAGLPKRLSLGEFAKGGMGLPPRITIYGRPSIGKTSIAAQADSPVFILSPQETGLQSLIDSGQLPPNIPHQEVEHWSQLLWIIDDLTTQQHSRKSLVLDTGNGLEKLANIHVDKTVYDGTMGVGKQGFLNFQIGYQTVAAGAWKELLSKLDILRIKRQMQIIMLCHTGVKNYKNATGDNYDRWYPAFDGKPTWEVTFAWADIVLFADYEVATQKDKGDTKAKGKGGDRRFFHCNWSAAWDAKNRYGLPDEIEMGSSAAEAWG